MSRHVTVSPTQENAPPRHLSRKTLKLHRDLSWQVASNLLVSFKYAWTGLLYAFETQRNFRIHTVIGTLVLGLSVLLQLEGEKIAIVALTIALVVSLELLNTAIESVVDLTIGHSYHELAKIAKDCAAGAVLVGALASAMVAGVIFVPPLLELWQKWVTL